MTANQEALNAFIESMQKDIDAKNKALELAIELLEIIDKGERIYETRLIGLTIEACKAVLSEKENK